MHPDHLIARKRWDWVAKLWCQDFVDCMSNRAQALLSWWPWNWHMSLNWDTLRQVDWDSKEPWQHFLHQHDSFWVIKRPCAVPQGQKEGLWFCASYLRKLKKAFWTVIQFFHGARSTNSRNGWLHRVETRFTWLKSPAASAQRACFTFPQTRKAPSWNHIDKGKVSKTSVIYLSCDGC